jgi:hypothetical protein
MAISYLARGAQLLEMDIVGQKFLSQTFDSEAPRGHPLKRFNWTLTTPRLIDVCVGLCSRGMQRDLRV